MQSEESPHVTDNRDRVDPAKSEREPEDDEEPEAVTGTDIGRQVRGNPVETRSRNLSRSSPFLGTFRWMCSFGGGGCREEFWPRVETERKERMDGVQRCRAFRLRIVV